MFVLFKYFFSSVVFEFHGLLPSIPVFNRHTVRAPDPLLYTTTLFLEAVLAPRMQEAITIDDVHAAGKRLAAHCVKTPLLESPFLNEIAGKRVLVKAECLQKTGSFKFRGGWSAVSALSDAEKERGVLAYSSGNHAQGVACAAQIAGIKAVILMPNDAPRMKLENTRSMGAEVILYDRPGGEQREKIGAALAAERGLTLIKPYDHPQVIAGQGTCGLELAEQAQALGVEKADVLVCCGGGGLTSGISIALEAHAPGLSVRPIEPEFYDDVIRSQIAGERQFVTGNNPSICDAIVTPSPGELTFPIIKRLCNTGFTVSDREALHAMGLAIQRLKVTAEPGGSVALAAALFHPEKVAGDVVICILSGGNTDSGTITAALDLLD